MRTLVCVCRLKAYKKAKKGVAQQEITGPYTVTHEQHLGFSESDGFTMRGLSPKMTRIFGQVRNTRTVESTQCQWQGS